MRLVLATGKQSTALQHPQTMLGHEVAGRCGFAGTTSCFRAANHRAAAARGALSVVCKESRIGKQIVPVPKSVTLTLTPELLKVKVRGGHLRHFVLRSSSGYVASGVCCGAGS